jgi:hypothetical protein
VNVVKIKVVDGSPFQVDPPKRGFIDINGRLSHESVHFVGGSVREVSEPMFEHLRAGPYGARFREVGRRNRRPDPAPASYQKE